MAGLFCLIQSEVSITPLGFLPRLLAQKYKTSNLCTPYWFCLGLAFHALNGRCIEAASFVLGKKETQWVRRQHVILWWVLEDPHSWGIKLSTEDSCDNWTWAWKGWANWYCRADTNIVQVLWFHPQNELFWTVVASRGKWGLTFPVCPLSSPHCK